MRYVNTQTGRELETDCVISGGGWQPLQADEQAEEKSEEAAEKKGKKKL